MSFHFRRHAPIRKGANFTKRIESLPGRSLVLEAATCGYCSMKAAAFCEFKNCGIPLCGKHEIRKAGGSLCKKHSGATLVQFDGIASERFGDRGEAHACSD